MKIAILSRNRTLYSTRRLVEAAQQRGHEVRVLDVLRCYMNITSLRPSIHYKAEALEGFDAVIRESALRSPSMVQPCCGNSR